MSDFFRMIDTIMCIFWVSTYALVLIGSFKYKYPMISLDAQAMIAPYEIAIVISFFAIDSIFNYAIAAYMIWSLLQITIITFTILYGNLKNKYIPVYLLFFVAVTMQMVYMVVYKDEAFLFANLNTFVGMIFWFIHILKKGYPMRPLALAAFSTKFVADVLGAITYLGEGKPLANTLSVLIPVVDLAFIIVFAVRMLQKKGKKQTVDMSTDVSE